MKLYKIVCGFWLSMDKWTIFIHPLRDPKDDPKDDPRHLHERGDVPSICLSSFHRQGPHHATSKFCNRWLPTLCPKKTKTCRSWAKLTDCMNGIYDKTPAQQGWHDTYRLVTPSCKLVYSFITPLTIDLTSIDPRFFRLLQGFPRFFQAQQGPWQRFAIETPLPPSGARYRPPVPREVSSGGNGKSRLKWMTEGYLHFRRPLNLVYIYI